MPDAVSTRRGKIVRGERTIASKRRHLSEPAATINRSVSELGERAPVLLLATMGLMIALYLALYQWGVFATVWDPIFHYGSEKVLHSAISRALPVPDAWIGVAGYAGEIVTGLIGGSRRWVSAPRLVLVYGGVVGAVALSGIALAILQLLLVQAGCTLCLTSSAISIVVAWLARTEILAAMRVLYEKREKK
jgi:uncharacterized membrane protein